MRTPGRPHTLRARLVATVLLLLAVAFAVIGVTTTFALRQFLYRRLDREVVDANNRFVAVQTGQFRPPGSAGQQAPAQRPPGGPAGGGEGPRRAHGAGLSTYPAPRMVWIMGVRPASIFLRR